MGGVASPHICDVGDSGGQDPPPPPVLSSASQPPLGGDPRSVLPPSAGQAGLSVEPLAEVKRYCLFAFSTFIFSGHRSREPVCVCSVVHSRLTLRPQGL